MPDVKILLIEDDQFLRELYVDLLKKEGYPVVKTNKKLVFLTNIDRPDELSKAESLSNGYIIKSTCTPEQFLEKVKAYLE